MAQGSQTTQDPQGAHVESNHLYTYPFRHKGFVAAYTGVLEQLEAEHAVILQGSEAIGKSTVAAEIANHYQQHGIEVIRFNDAVNTPRQLYALLAEALHVPKLKKELVLALRKSQAEGRFCLVILDEDAVNSSPAVSEALRKLCTADSKTSGAIKLLVVSTDYLVIHTKNTYETDFHDWIRAVIQLNKLTADDLGGLTHYLAEQHHCPLPEYELGADLVLLEQSEGKIKRLIELIVPLLENSVIGQESAVKEDKNVHPLDSRFARYYFLGAAAVLVLLVSLLMKQLISAPLPETTLAEKDEETRPVFLEETTAGSDLPAKPTVQLPTLEGESVALAAVQTSTDKPAEAEPAQTTRQTQTVKKALSPQMQQPPIATADILAQVSKTIDRWLNNWAERSPQTYFQHYSTAFKGDTSSREDWINQRTSALLNPAWIKLKREKLQNARVAEDQVQVDFWLDYHSSSGYRDRTFKRLVLSRMNNKWLIISEENLTVVRR